MSEIKLKTGDNCDTFVDSTFERQLQRYRDGEVRMFPIKRVGPGAWDVMWDGQWKRFARGHCRLLEDTWKQKGGWSGWQPEQGFKQTEYPGPLCALSNCHQPARANRRYCSDGCWQRGAVQNYGHVRGEAMKLVREKLDPDTRLQRVRVVYRGIRIMPGDYMDDLENL